MFYQDISQYNSILDKKKYPNIKMELQLLENQQEPETKYGYDENLNSLRNKISDFPETSWKMVRWFVNKYDFVVKNPAINRAFYKYWEIVNTFSIFKYYNYKDLIFHMAEAPGGFIQGSNIYIEHYNYSLKDSNTLDEDGFIQSTSKKNTKKLLNKNSKKLIYTISLNKTKKQYKHLNLPVYNGKILAHWVKTTYGEDRTGSILNWNNLSFLHTINNDRNFYLITADGGFDEGTDYNHKEQLHFELILSEIYGAIKLQKRGGNFILKVFDIFTQTSLEMIYLLCCFYKEVYIFKPHTSRPTNSEKYIVCKNFTEDILSRNSVCIQLSNFKKQLDKYKQNSFFSFRIFENIPKKFYNDIKQCNLDMCNIQCEKLQTAIDLCKDEEFLENYNIYINDNLLERQQVFSDWSKKFYLDKYINFD